MRLKIGNRLLEYFNLSPYNTFVNQLLNLSVPAAAKLNYIEAEIENGKLKISYLPDSRPSSTPFTSTQRQTAKPITVFKKLLPDADLPKLNSWIDLLKAHFALPEHTISAISGHELLEMYDEKNYVPGNSSTLHQSCMRYEKCQPYIEFYVRNKNVVSGVCVDIDGKIAARALVWRATHNRKKVSVLDRIYATTDVIGSIINTWAKDNCDYTINHVTKYFRNNKENTDECLDLYIGLQDTKGPYPYLDNFRFLMGQRLYNIYSPRVAGISLASTEGLSTSFVPQPGYRAGYAWGVDNVWKPKNKVILIGTRYIEKKNVVNCIICNKFAELRNSKALMLNNKRVYSCGNHIYPVYINDTMYSICTLHNALFPTEGECLACLLAPKNCAHCGNYVNTAERINHKWYCIPCTGFTTCSGCNTETPIYATFEHMRLNDEAVVYCQNCRASWVRCVDCGDLMEPNYPCPCGQYYRNCSSCDERRHEEDIYILEEEEYCYVCYTERVFTCNRCGYEYAIEHLSEHIEHLCQACYNAAGFVCTICTQHTINTSHTPEVCYGCWLNLEHRCFTCLARIVTAGVCHNCTRTNV